MPCWVSRSGYTGEDGFEISLANHQAEGLVRKLLQSGDVELIGLGARDTLRLEAGLCLYGNELDTSTTPVEAGLKWIITPGHKQYPGAAVIKRHLYKQRRVGLRVSGKIPVRKEALISNGVGDAVGVVTSGSYAPTVEEPIAMAYIQNEYTELGTKLIAEVRNKQLELTVTVLPFVPHRYCR